MYCKQCGTKNSSEALYCQHDGVALTDIKDKKPTLIDQGNQHCSTCGGDLMRHARYCTTCGTGTEVNRISTVQASTPFVPESPHTQSETTPLSFVKLAIYPIAALIILSIIAAMFAGSLNNFIADEFFDGFGFGVSINIISFIDVLMVLHSVSLTFNLVEQDMMNMDLLMQGGLVFMLLLPAIVFSIVGFLIGRKKIGQSIQQKAIHILVPAVIYALLLSIVSLFATRTTDILDAGFFGTFSLTASYGFFSAFIHGFVISALFITVGLTLSLASHNFSYLSAFKRAVIHSVACLLVLTAAVGMTSDLSKEDYDDQTLPYVALLSQLGSYTWHISQLSTISADIDFYYEKYSVSYSALTGAKVTPEDDYVKEDIEEVFGGARFFVLIPILIHGLAGFLWVSRQRTSLLRAVVAYAVSVGLIHSVVIWLTSFSLTFWEGSVQIGSSWFIGFFISTLFAGASAWVGCILSQKFRQEDTYINKSAA
ncbi:zinc ribbon domain-containing protein [Alkalicoccobacillus murimartini]|uniref:Integral membrane protein n=1 Tax=Alkalicoccobacillus murimartini TaxID=171685 RepID=A0ABT9YGF2_9BACI|nr:zinc ribbon domain-containing protein [Alkalicoccobacillus murimartini]MDQ0206944.1 putative integral membrane protein [Alkalicoccobacillus murimartini]